MTAIVATIFGKMTHCSMFPAQVNAAEISSAFLLILRHNIAWWNAIM